MYKNFLVIQMFSSSTNVDFKRHLILTASHAQVMDLLFFILYFYNYSKVPEKMLNEFSKKFLNYMIRTLVRVC
jgi:hypothetical protein